jgi:hypothetical protein
MKYFCRIQSTHEVEAESIGEVEALGILELKRALDENRFSRTVCIWPELPLSSATAHWKTTPATQDRDGASAAASSL